jgi:hypothetical protein
VRAGHVRVDVERGLEGRSRAADVPVHQQDGAHVHEHHGARRVFGPSPREHRLRLPALAGGRERHPVGRHHVEVRLRLLRVRGEERHRLRGATGLRQVGAEQ